MKVNKIMTKIIGFCQAEDDLAKAVEIMREKDCGFVPVVNKKSEVIGTVTDRDVAIAVFIQKKTASKNPIGDIISDAKIIICSEKDEVEDVLKKMQKHQIKRLPVIDQKEKLCGVISITDILFAARKDKSLKKKIFKTLESIGKPRPIVLKAV